jgi:putative transposase
MFASQCRITSWLFGHRLSDAGLLGSMGKVACAYDNALMESFWSSMQIELLDRRSWPTPAALASAMFEWIEAFYNRIRRHSAWTTSPRSSTNVITAPPTRRPEHHTNTVRETGNRCPRATVKA